jgi:hypothetical protein
LDRGDSVGVLEGGGSGVSLGVKNLDSVNGFDGINDFVIG